MTVYTVWECLSFENQKILLAAGWKPPFIKKPVPKKVVNLDTTEEVAKIMEQKPEGVKREASW